MATVSAIAGFHLKKNVVPGLQNCLLTCTVCRSISVVTPLGSLLLAGKQAIWHLFYSIRKKTSFYATMIDFQLKTFTKSCLETNTEALDTNESKQARCGHHFVANFSENT